MSAVVAILRGEDDSEALARRICPPRLDVGGQLRGIDVRARPIAGSGSHPPPTASLQTLGIEVIPVSVEQSRLAGEAYRSTGAVRVTSRAEFSGTRSHYALAVSENQPLLFVVRLRPPMYRGEVSA